MSKSTGSEKEDNRPKEGSQRKAVIELSQRGRKAATPPAEPLLTICKHTDKRSDLAKLRHLNPKKLQKEEELQQTSTFLHVKTLRNFQFVYFQHA